MVLTWDCIKKTLCKGTEYDDELDGTNNMEIQNTVPDDDILGNYKNINEILNTCTHKQPRAEFLPDHVEAMSHVLKINKPNN